MNSRHVYPFEKLRVWQYARELVSKIHALTQSLRATSRVISSAENSPSLITAVVNARRNAQPS